MTSNFDTATAVQPLSSHKYSAHFPDEWCIGSVPNGGYITSCFLRVARLHFSTTLAHQNQPDTMALHLEFLRRTQTGPATFHVEEKKLGSRVSVLHITLYQHGREEVVGYVSQTNLATEQGVSMASQWAPHPPPLPVDLRKLALDADENWALQSAMPFLDFRKASARLKWFFPRRGQRCENMSDEWIGWRTGEKMTQDALGFACDNFPLEVESFVEDRPYDVEVVADASSSKEVRKRAFGEGRWYPTVLLNLDIVKKLPSEGVDFLFVRAQSKRIKNGRLDVEVTILDDQGDLVALSHHVVLVVSADRNIGVRRGSGGKL